MTNSELTPPKPGTKIARLLKQLSGKGATLKALSKSLGWQEHTVRAAMTGLRKRGYQIHRADGEEKQPATYRIEPQA